MIRRGFSLVELLVCIAVIAVLLALAIPALMKARSAAHQSISLSNIRQSTMALLSQAEERDGLIPTAPITNVLVDGRGQPTVTVQFASGDLIMMSWFLQCNAWPMVLLSMGVECSDAWYSPRSVAAEAATSTHSFGPSDYTMGHGFLATASFFDGVTRQEAALCAPQRLADVRHPARKGLLFERTASLVGSIVAAQAVPEANHLGMPRPVSGVDGHVAVRRFSDDSGAVENRMNGNVKFPVLTTRDGVRGVDM